MICGYNRTYLFSSIFFLFLQSLPEYYLILYAITLNVVFDAGSIQIFCNAAPTNQLCSNPFFGFRKKNSAATGYLELLFMYLEFLENIQSSIHSIIGPSLASRILSLSLGRGVTYLYFFYDYFHGDFSNEL